MRRSRMAVSGVVCALFVSSGTLVGCRSSEQDTARLAQQQQQPQQKLKPQSEPPREEASKPAPLQPLPPNAYQNVMGSKNGARSSPPSQGSNLFAPQAGSGAPLGALGAGHTVTALYELELEPGAGQGLATVRVRAKKPRGEKATERAFVFPGSGLAPTFGMAKEDLRFATAVMGAAELLRGSPHARRWNFDQVRKIARDATPPGNSEREEFLELLDKAQPLVGRVAAR